MGYFITTPITVRSTIYPDSNLAPYHLVMGYFRTIWEAKSITSHTNTLTSVVPKDVAMNYVMGSQNQYPKSCRPLDSVPINLAMGTINRNSNIGVSYLITSNYDVISANDNVVPFVQSQPLNHR